MAPPPRRVSPRRAAPDRHRVWLLVGAVGGGIAALGVLFGVALLHRVETGRWDVPDREDFVRIVKGRSARAPQTIFLERRPVELRPGIDDASMGVSSVLASGKNKPVRTAGWKGGDKRWSSLIACVEKLFAPFEVEITDQRPAHENFVLVAVGGRATDLGIKSHHVGGLAPFNGEVIPTPIVFAFSASLGHDVRAICETIGMEVAHAYGLDHAYLCKDVMTYLTGCGAKSFVDKDVRCGEKKPRTCESGAATQNSYQHLAKVLGARAK